MLGVTIDPASYHYCACNYFYYDENSYKDLKKVESWVGPGVKSSEDLSKAYNMGSVLITSDEIFICNDRLKGLNLR